MIALLALIVSQGGDTLEDRRDTAVRAAAARVAPSLVTIETSGGTEIVGGQPGAGGRPGAPRIRRGLGPTTGIVVGADGWIISSAFNFANKPTSILVAVGGKRHVAKVVATDRTRMLTLLKVETTDLVVPVAASRADIRVGQSALALGRTLAPALDAPPSISLGIVSALDRVWGKALQTDAKVSPVNYGGPLIDIEGRVLGILVPASPQGEGDTAGFEWYDSGIGFAIYFDDALAILPRLKAGRDLEKGMLGIALEPGDQHEVQPKIATVAPGSAAEKSGLKAGDIITVIGGKPIGTPAQMLHALGRLYQGDKVQLTVRRGAEDIKVADMELGGPQAAIAMPWLGILPTRDDIEPGVLVRAVQPGGPADKAGMKAGDRIVGIARGPIPLPVQNRDSFGAFLESQMPGIELSLLVRRANEAKDAKAQTVKVAIGALPGDLVTRPEGTPSVKGAKPPENPPAAKIETGIQKKNTASGSGKYWLHLPANYRPDVAHALVVWMHPFNKGKDKDLSALFSAWEPYCEKHRLVILAPQSETDSDWTPGDAEWIAEAIRETQETLAIDKRRVVVHGMGSGGLMAYYLGFNKRDLTRGVAAVGSPMGTAARDKVPGQPLAFFLVVGDRDPAREGVEQTRQKLQEKRYPVMLRLMEDAGSVYLDEPSIKGLVDWIDTLDRL